MFNHPELQKYIEAGAAIVRRWYDGQGKKCPVIDLHRSGISARLAHDYVVISGLHAILLVARIVDGTEALLPVSYDEWPVEIKDIDTLYRGQLAMLRFNPVDADNVGGIPNKPPYITAPLLPIARDVAYDCQLRQAARETLTRPL